MHRLRIPARGALKVLIFLALAVSPLSGCVKDGVTPSYSKADIEPVLATRTSDTSLQISFNDPLESVFHAAGMSYVIAGEEMRVTVDRCPISGTCKTMLPLEITPGRPNPATQVIPILAPRVVMVFADGEQQIFP